MPKSSLNRKILLLGLLITLAYLGLNGLILVGVVRHGFDTVEIAQARQDLQRCHAILQTDLEQLANSCRDYASRDEVHHFLADRNPDFIATNLGEEIYGNLQLDFVRITDHDQRVVYERSRADGPFARVALPAIPLSDDKRARATVSPRFEGGEVVGLRPSAAGLVLAAVYPIRDNSQLQPARGYLTFARLLSAEHVRALADTIHLDFAVAMLASGELDRAPLRAMPRGDNFLRITRNNRQQDIFSLLKDPAGKPVGSLSLALSRDVTRIGTRVISLGVLALATGLGICLGAFVWFNHRYVTRNLRAMTQSVIRLSDGDDGTSEVPVLSRDEVGILAEKFNRLLARNREMNKTLTSLVDVRTSELHQANEALLLAGQVFDNVLEAILITDRNGVIVRANPAFSTITGFTVEEALGRKPSLMKSDHHPPDFYAEMWKQLTAVGRWQGEIWNRRKNGEVFPAMLSITSLRNAEGEIVHYIGTLEDISLNKLNEERIRHLAFHDPLTGLSNRVLFADRTATSIQRAKREGRQLAMIVLDLDGFKLVNDTYGHAMGDQLLIEVARRLEGALRAEDTVARFGGDEFTALLPQIETHDSALTVAQKILATIESPIAIAGQQVRVSASIGVSLYPQHGETFQALFEAADGAMYRVKTAGKSGVGLADLE